MVPVRVADKDMADRPPGDGAPQCRVVCIVNRARIDQRQRIAADQITVGAEKGEGAGIVDRDALDIRRNLDGFAIMRRKRTVENEGHGGVRTLCMALRILRCGVIPNIPFSTHGESRSGG